MLTISTRNVGWMMDSCQSAERENDGLSKKPISQKTLKTAYTNVAMLRAVRYTINKPVDKHA